MLHTPDIREHFQKPRTMLEKKGKNKQSARPRGYRYAQNVSKNSFPLAPAAAHVRTEFSDEKQ